MHFLVPTTSSELLQNYQNLLLTCKMGCIVYGRNDIACEEVIFTPGVCTIWVFRELEFGIPGTFKRASSCPIRCCFRAKSISPSAIHSPDQSIGISPTFALRQAFSSLLFGHVGPGILSRAWRCSTASPASPQDARGTLPSGVITKMSPDLSRRPGVEGR